jgi:hypothetical protein
VRVKICGSAELHILPSSYIGEGDYATDDGASKLKSLYGANVNNCTSASPRGMAPGTRRSLSLHRTALKYETHRNGHCSLGG